MRALVSRPLAELGVAAAFFERSGGVSRAPFVSLNGSFRSGDDREAVATNRARAAAAFSVDRFTVPGLVHGTAIEPVDRTIAGDGFDGPADRLADADGLVTDEPGVALAAYSGDCVIVAIASETHPRVGLVHAGWRGLAAGIVQAAVATFGDPSRLRAALGPTIGPCHYEVGEEVIDAVGPATPGGALVRRESGCLFLDLVGSVRRVLGAAGVGTVHDAGTCTACHLDRFFSHRAERRTGRHLALAVRTTGTGV